MRTRLACLVLLCLFLLCLGGCQSLSLNPAPPVQLKLLPPTEGPAASLLEQVVTLEAKGQQRQFLVVTKIQQARVDMVALLPTGQRLLTLQYDGQQLAQQQLGVMELPGEDILAMLQFALWPVTSVKRHYTQQQGWVVLANSQTRVLRHQADTVLEVFYQQQGLVVENHSGNYRVEIRTLENKAL